MRANKQAPSRHKMAFITFVIILALVHIIMPIISANVPAPVFFQEVVAVTLIVSLTTYAIMPVVTKLLKNWLMA